MAGIELSLQLKRGLSSQTPDLKEGEPSFDTDTKRLRVGTSTTENVEFYNKTDVDTLVTTEVGSVDSKISAHKAEEGAHTASTISFIPGGTLTTTSVQNAIGELDFQFALHAHSASSVANTPAGNIAASTVQDAINELDSEKAPSSHVGATGTAHGNATGSVAGFMSSTDKSKLDTIEASANNYVHPATHSADIITDGTTNKAYTSTEKTKLAGVADNANNYVHPATHSADIIVDGTTNHVFTAADDTKLAGIATGANLYVHPNHTGEVTSTADGATVIANSAVTNAKMANMAQNTIKGRITASTGAPEDLTAANVRTIINVADGANNYTHPTGDGNLHVPANGTTNNGKALVASASAGTYTWAAPAPAAHATTHVTGGADVIANAVAGGNAGLMSGADKTKLDGIAAGAEVNVNADWNSASGDSQILNKPTLGTMAAQSATAYVAKADYDAQTILVAVSDNTPAALSVPASTIVGRAATGDITALTATQTRTILNVADGANNYTHPSGDGNLHVPATGTTNAGKVLTAGASAGSLSWVSPGAPGAHATTHVTGGTDVIANAVAGGNAGLMSGTDKTKLDGIATNANNYTHPNHTGDVTSTGDGATVIGANKVTLAMMAQMATASFLGRNTAATGNVEVLSTATVKSMLGLGTAAYTASTDYAVAAKGVTNGDSHDHNGGDGATIDHVNLANKGSNTHAQIDTALTNSANHIASTVLHVPSPTNNAGKYLTTADGSTLSWATVTGSGNTVAVLTGSITNGSTIPLPSGFTHAQCTFQVFIDSISTGDNVGNASVSVTVNTSTRVVTITQTNSANVWGTARYIIVGVK